MGQPFQALAVDDWNGGQAQVEFYAEITGITFPVLMNAGLAGLTDLYNCGYHYYFVIGGDGIILWRGSSNQGLSDTAIRAAIDQGLEDLASSPVGDAPQARNRLLANYPNPFNPSTRIPFEVGDVGGSAQVKLDVLNLRGQVVRTLVDEQRAGGRAYEAIWNGTDFRGRLQPSGSYITRLTVDGKTQSRVMTLVK